MRDRVLPGYQPLASFPRMKAPRPEEFERRLRAPGLVVQARQFHCEIVSLFHQTVMFLEYG